VPTDLLAVGAITVLAIALFVSGRVRIDLVSLLVLVTLASFAAVLGGTMTLIGTSTNLLVHALAQRQGLAGFTMFEFAPLGLVLTVIGLAYMLVVGIHLLPARKTGARTEQYRLRDYLTEIAVAEDSKLVGRPLGEAFGVEHGVDVLRCSAASSASCGRSTSRSRPATCCSSTAPSTR
jgi:di/tricarboxylate transporter